MNIIYTENRRQKREWFRGKDVEQGSSSSDLGNLAPGSGNPVKPVSSGDPVPEHYRILTPKRVGNVYWSSRTVTTRKESPGILDSVIFEKPVDLAGFLDSGCRSRHQTDLGLKLMTWRIHLKIYIL